MPGAPLIQRGVIPVFFEDFLVNLRDQRVHHAMCEFGRARDDRYINPVFTFDGLERRSGESMWTHGEIRSQRYVDSK